MDGAAGRPVHKLGEEISRLSTKNKQMKQKVEEISEENKQLRDKLIQQSNKRDEINRPMLDKYLTQQVEEISEEIKQLKDQLNQLSNKRDEEVNCPKQELKKTQEKPSRLPGFGGKNFPMEGFCVQIRIAGKTGGCERKFLKDVSKRLSCHKVSLKEKAFTEASKDPLLVFCPIASCMGNAIENSLQGLSGQQKVLLVVMHYVERGNPGPAVDPRQKVPHPAVVQTVHTCYTLQDGLYPCEMNKAAVADVADAIQALAEDH